MSGKRAFEEQIAALDELRTKPGTERSTALRKALGQRNNFLVAKAADLAREFELKELTPELLAAFDRFFKDAVKSDPQCWAKNALSRTLAQFEHHDAAVFLRGMKHIQLEPVWGGTSDSAATLRATCAVALVQCRSLTDTELLAHLIELFADEEKSVRAAAAQAIEQVGSPSSALLLRLKAMIGNDEPEVLGACYGGILRLEGGKAIPWIARFLQNNDESEEDAAGEAALALAATHSTAAFEALRGRFEQPSDAWFRSVLLSAIALTRLDEATDFLFSLIQREDLSAEAAVEAVLRSLPSGEVSSRLEKLVAGNPRLKRVFAANRAEPRK